MQRELYNQGGIMSVPRSQYGLGSFVKSIGKGVKKVAKGIGDVFDKENLDKLAQVAAFIPGPHQPFAQAYTGARGSGLGGDYGGLQIGGYTPGSGNFFGSAQQAGTFGMPNQGQGGLGNFVNILSSLDSSQDPNKRAGGGNDGIGEEKGIGDILQGILQDEEKRSTIADILKGAGSLYGGYVAREDQKRINEARQRAYDDYIARRRAVEAQLEETIPDLDIRNAAAEGGIMDLDVRVNPKGVKEIDYRQKGGFVPPIGIKEKADDIPAMLSNNEFVFTADAVRGMGNGNVNKGAKKMYALMKKLEGQS